MAAAPCSNPRAEKGVPLKLLSTRGRRQGLRRAFASSSLNSCGGRSRPLFPRRRFGFWTTSPESDGATATVDLIAAAEGAAEPAPPATRTGSSLLRFPCTTVGSDGDLVR
jgi:hypothetical protein